MTANAETTAAGRGATGEIRVLVVDDHAMVRAGLCRIIEEEPGMWVCGEAATGTEAMASVSRSRPSVALVDIHLKGESGLDVIRTLRRRHPKLPILAVSMYEESLYGERAVHAGAQGYIMKSLGGDELVRAIRAVVREGAYLSPDLSRRVVRNAASKSAASRRRPGLAGLSNREMAVLQLMGGGLSTRAIAGNMRISIKTVQTYYAHIKRKMGLSSVPDLIRHAVHWTGPAGEPKPARRRRSRRK